jgi:vancomycin permeability regulator SanA
MTQEKNIKRATFTRSQRTTVVYGILSIVIVILMLQLWLVTATMNAYLGGDSSVPIPALIVSGIFLLLNVGLLRYIYRMERARR